MQAYKVDILEKYQEQKPKIYWKSSIPQQNNLTEGKEKKRNQMFVFSSSPKTK